MTVRKQPPGTCGCSCGCHIKSHTGYPDGCRGKAVWLPKYRVWACKQCLEMCDG